MQDRTDRAVWQTKAEIDSAVGPTALTASAKSAAPSMRERILQSAPEAIRRFTLARFSMDDVARSAGIARQTIYKHFRNKDALLIALYIRHMSERHDPAMTKVLELEPSADNLATVFMVELQAARTFPLFDETLDPKTAPFMAELSLNSPEMMVAHERRWSPILRRYQASGVCREDLDIPMTVRWIVYQEFWFLTHPQALSPNDQGIKSFVRAFIVPALLTHPEATRAKA